MVLCELALRNAYLVEKKKTISIELLPFTKKIKLLFEDQNILGSFSFAHFISDVFHLILIRLNVINKAGVFVDNLTADMYL